MLKKKKIRNITIILFAILITLTITALKYFEDKNPIQVIENTIHFSLPDESNIINFTDLKESGYYYYEAKLMIAKDDVDDVKRQLHNYFGDLTMKHEDTPLPNIKNTCSWWDLEYGEISSYYTKSIAFPKRLLSNIKCLRDIWAFLVTNEDGNYYLYLSY